MAYTCPRCGVYKVKSKNDICTMCQLELEETKSEWNKPVKKREAPEPKSKPDRTEKLIVFTLGAEAASTSVKYRINPFETVKGISLQTHIDYLLSTFKAAFELYPPMPYVLEEAVYEIYRDKGWDITEKKQQVRH